MISKLSKTITIILASILGFSLFSFSLAPATHAAGVCNQKDKVPEEVWKAAGCDGSTDDDLPQVIVGILNAIILVSGLIATVFVLIGGINYMTSAGDAGKLEKAKKTILYACIGLIITALSFAIVNFTITHIIEGRRSSSSEANDSSSKDSDGSSSKDTDKSSSKDSNDSSSKDSDNSSSKDSDDSKS